VAEEPSLSSPLGVSRGIGGEIRKVLWITLLLNLLVAGAKIAIGTLTSTLSLLADGYHSLLDGSNNIVGLIALRFAHKPPDEEHQYGHRKLEVMASMVISVALFGMAYEVVMASMNRLHGASAPRPGGLTLAIIFGTLAVNLFVTRYEARKGRELHSHFLIADSKHTLSDVFATSGVLLAVLLLRVGLWWADPLAAVAIAGVIVLAGFRILMSGLDVIADRRMIEPREIEATVLADPAARSCRNVRTRGFPDAVFLDMIVMLDPALSLKEAHVLCDRIEESLRRRFPELTDIVIHPEPDLPAPGEALRAPASTTRAG
jgi:cation diffusion facilitator family transporter